MNIQKLVDTIKSSTQHNYIYHFTDEENFPQIKQHGLLSKVELNRLGIKPQKPSGNDWSWDADAHKGISEYISVCLTRSHPMCHTAQAEKRISTPRYLCIEPNELLRDGVMFAFDIANKSGVEILPLEEALDGMDIEVLYTRTDWKDDSIQARLKAVERYEVLVPVSIPLNQIPRVF
jgi:hypothetical protein